MKKKTIHIYTQYYYPVVNACSNRVENYITALKDDYNIKVITGMPNYPTGVKLKKYKWKIFKKEIGKYGEIIVRTYEFATKNEGSLGRILNYISFMISSFIYGLFFKKPDIIIVISPPLFTAIGVLLLNKIKKIPYILEVHDLWPDSIVELGYMNNKTFVFKIFKLIEKVLYNNSTNLIGLTQGVVDGIKFNISSDEKEKVILNYFVSEKINKIKENPYKKYNSIIKKRKIALFAGNMNEAYDMDYAINYIRNNNNIFFVFIGDGSQRKKIERQKKLNNLLLLDRMSKNKVDKFLYFSDIIFIPLKNNIFFKGTFPVKGIEAIVNKKEIIFSGPKDGEFQLFLNKTEIDDKIFSFLYFKNNICNLISKTI